MNEEKSCGAVVFTKENGKIQYLLVQNLHGIYGFPKGHVEPGEGETETARREVFEETGLKVDFLPGFRAEDVYPSPAIEGVMKRVVYFLAEFSGQEYCFQKTEISGGGLCAYQEAVNLLQFESTKRILTEANRFLSAK